VLLLPPAPFERLLLLLLLLLLMMMMTVVLHIKQALSLISVIPQAAKPWVQQGMKQDMAL